MACEDPPGGLATPPHCKTSADFRLDYPQPAPSIVPIAPNPRPLRHVCFLIPVFFVPALLIAKLKANCNRNRKGRLC